MRILNFCVKRGKKSVRDGDTDEQGFPKHWDYIGPDHENAKSGRKKVNRRETLAASGRANGDVKRLTHKTYVQSTWVAVEDTCQVQLLHFFFETTWESRIHA